MSVPFPSPSEMENDAPHNVDAERGVLGALLLAPGALVDVDPLLSANDFYYPAHRALYAVLSDLHARRQPIDYVTITDELERRGELEAAGGRGYLVEMTARVPTTGFAAYYAEIVANLARMRDLMAAGEAIRRLGLDTSTSAAEHIAHAGEIVAAVAARGNGGTVTHHTLTEMVGEYMEHLDETTGDGALARAIPTGFDDLDRMTGGFQRGDLIILGARPSMGKTSWMLNAARGATTHGARVAVFSLEMSREQLVGRLLAVEASVDVARLRGRDLTEAEWGRVVPALAALNGADILIDDGTTLTTAAMRAACTRMAREGALDLIVVDYIQIFDGPEGKRGRSDNRVQELSAISRDLKAIAREFDAPMLALSQLSRALESRQDKRPILSDLRDSGALEQDADIVMFLYRDFVYTRDAGAEHEAELIVAKHRNGPTGVISLYWSPAETRFASLATPAQTARTGQQRPEGRRGRARNEAAS